MKAHRILFTADLHFDDRGAWVNRGILGDAEYAFMQIVEYAIDQQASALLLGGDILNRADAWPDLVKFFHTCFDLLKDARVSVYYVLGQHDGRQDWLSVHGHPLHLHGAAATLDGTSIDLVGLDWLPPDEYLAAIQRLPPCATLLTHQVWAELMGRKGSADCRLADLPDTIRTVYTGDFHQSLVRTVNRPSGVPLVAYSPGPIALQAVDESDEKSFLFGTLGDELATVPLRGRGIARFASDEPDLADRVAVALDQLKARAERLDLPDPLHAPLIVLSGPGESTVIRQVRSVCARRGHLFFAAAAAPAGVPASDDGGRARVAAVTSWGLSGALPEAIRPESPAYGLALSLLGAPDVRAELEAQRAAFLAQPKAETHAAAS